MLDPGNHEQKDVQNRSETSVLPPGIEELLRPAVPIERVQPELDEPRFDVTANAVPAPAFFQGLVEDTPFNIIVHPDVSGTVTLSLTDVSVPEVMALMRDGYDYHFEATSAGFIVLPDTMQSRVFTINYLNVDRKGSTGTRISTGDIGEATSQQGARDRAGSELTTTSRSRLWEDIERILNGMIADEKDAGASVVVSPAGGMIVVRASPRSQLRIESFIARLDQALNRQVILEARILEVVLDDAASWGIDWSAVGSEGGEAFEADFEPGTLSRASSDSAFSLGLLRDGDFQVTIQALQRQGQVRVLSAPRVSTLNNVKALIKVGSDAFFQTGVELNTQNFQGERFTDVQPEFAPFFSGISLDVTPNISADGWVTLHVQPSVTTVEEVPRSLDLGGQQASFRLASSEVRQADSIVRALDGDLVVIGGLIQEREERIDSGLPILGQLPGLGWAFGGMRRITRKVELVILIRPRIIEAGGWQVEVERGASG